MSDFKGKINNRCWCDNKTLILNLKSLEHVIPKAIGGHLTSSSLLCRECNNHFGTSIDPILVSQLERFADQLGIKIQHSKKYQKRYTMMSESGKVKVVTGKLKTLSKMVYPTHNDGHIVEYVPDKDAPAFIVRKQKELRAHGLETTYVESIEESDGEKYKAVDKSTGLVGNFEIGGIDFFRAIAKIAVNFAVLNGINKAMLTDIINFVKGEHKNDDYVSWYYPNNYKIHELDEGEVNHIIYLKGDRQHRMLYVYIELFSCQNLIVLLNTEYQGDEFEKTYVFDLIETKEVEKVINIRMVRGHFMHLWMSHSMMKREHIYLYNRLEKIIEIRQIQ